MYCKIVNEKAKVYNQNRFKIIILRSFQHGFRVRRRTYDDEEFHKNEISNSNEK